MTAMMAMPYFQSEFDNVGTTGHKIAVIFAMYTVWVILLRESRIEGAV